MPCSVTVVISKLARHANSLSFHYHSHSQCLIYSITNVLALVDLFIEENTTNVPKFQILVLFLCLVTVAKL